MATTSRYPFEAALGAWAASWSNHLTGARAAFFVGLRDDGSVRRVYTCHPERPFTPEKKQLLGQEYRNWFLFLPHEQGAYLEWLALPRPVVERWVGRAFVPVDFTDVQGAVRDGWPPSWRVIIG